MKKFHALPERKYSSGEKKMISLRMPSDLMNKLNEIAADRGWTTSDVVVTALDEYAQWYYSRPSKGGRFHAS
jgi:metal-responsive CopG/Arc/MetJ family transcriptional regulator